MLPWDWRANPTPWYISTGFCDPTVYLSDERICAGDSIEFRGQYLKEEGMYYDSLLTYLGCDSVLALALSIDSIESTVWVDSNALVTDTSDSYQWYDCSTMQAIPGATSQGFTPKVNGTYAVVVTRNACVDTSDCVDVNWLSINTYHQLDLGDSSQSIQGSAVREDIIRRECIRH